MSKDKMEELLQQKAQWDDDIRKSQRRSSSGRLAHGGGTFASGGLTTVVNGLDDAGIARQLCSTGDVPAAHELLKKGLSGLLADDERAALLAAASYCMRRADEGSWEERIERAVGMAAEAVELHTSSKLALLEMVYGFLDANKPASALSAAEALHQHHRDCSGLGALLLQVHATGRRVDASMVSGYRVGQHVQIATTIEGFFRQGDRAVVLGLANADAPIALQMEQTGRFVDVQEYRVEQAEPVEQSRLGGWFASLTGSAEEPAKTASLSAEHYQVLQLPSDATNSELKRFYRAASKRTHPDKMGGDDAAFQAVAEAHAVLSDVELKRQFDQGDQLPRMTSPFTLREEIRKFYFPELVGFRPFGDPFENRKFHRPVHHRTRAGGGSLERDL